MTEHLHCTKCGTLMAELRDASIRKSKRMAVYCGDCDDDLKRAALLASRYAAPEFFRGFGKRFKQEE